LPLPASWWHGQKKLKSVDASGWPVRTIHSFHDTATVSTGGKF
jgi:hypothetical protein